MPHTTDPNPESQTLSIDPQKYSLQPLPLFWLFVFHSPKFGSFRPMTVSLQKCRISSNVGASVLKVGALSKVAAQVIGMRLGFL